VLLIDGYHHAFDQTRYLQRFEQHRACHPAASATSLLPVRFCSRDVDEAQRPI